MENQEKQEVEEVKNPSTEQIVTEPSTEGTGTDAPVEDTAPKKKKGKNGLVVAILCIVLIIGVAVLFGPSLLKKDTNKIETDKTKVSSTYRLSGNGLEKFDLYFLQLENKQANMVYSPLSIKYALAMLNEGTDGASHDQIEAVIGDYKAKKYNNNEHMSFANVMFIRNTFKDKIQESYTKTLQDKYGAEVIIDPFENANPMNDWVSNRTFGLVNKMVDDNDVQSLDFILANALAIDMNWVNQIHCTTGHSSNVGCIGKAYSVRYSHEKLKGEEQEYSKTSYPYAKEEDFPALTFNGNNNYKSAEVFASFNRYDIIKELGEDQIREEVSKAYQDYLDYIQEANPMEYNEVEKDVDKYVDIYVSEIKENYGKEAKSTDFMLLDDDEVKVFAKDLQEYDGTTLQYVGIMPKNEDLATFIRDLDEHKIIARIDDLKPLKAGAFKDGVVTLIEGKIPMFKYDYDLNLQDDLTKLGIKDIFSEKADLSKMLNDVKEERIEASHSATIEFSNDGIKAGAVTALGGFGSSMGGFNYLFEVPVERIDITFDKPYMYLIRDKATGEVWFIGTVYDPIKK